MIKAILFLLLTAGLLSAADYRPGPEAQRQPGVPKGKVIQGEWNDCKHYPGTTRSYWVYIPAQYDGGKPAS